MLPESRATCDAGATMICIRAMTVDDLDLGLQLREQAGFNQTAADWQRFLALEPAGCFVAELAGRAVGTTTTCIFDSVGWIAMVLVDPSARHQGIGTRLVQHAMAWLKQRGVQTIRLDATALGRPVYERLGFVAEYELVRLEGRATLVTESSPGGANLSPLQPEDLEAVAALDEKVTGTRRLRLLDRLRAEQPQAAAKIVVDGTVQGYAMFRRGTHATHIGPVIANTAETGRTLLAWAFRCCAGQPVFVDIPCDNSPALEWASSHGLIP